MAGCKGAEATFQPEWPVHTAAKPNGKNKIAEMQTHLPIPSPPQPTAWNLRDSQDTSDSILRLVASGCRKEVLGTGAPLPATSQQGCGAPRQRQPSHRGMPTLGIWGIFDGQIIHHE